MNRQNHETSILKDNDRVAVLGGGPAGAFFAFHLLRLARQAGRKLAVSIIDPRMAVWPDGSVKESRGCNCCAGMISPRLQKALDQCGIALPETVVCQDFTHIWIHGLWKNFPLKVPAGQKVLSVLRGTLPMKRDGTIQGFDAFILKQALDQGACLITARAVCVTLTPDKKPSLLLEPETGERFCLETEFACICPGVNFSAGNFPKSNSLLKSFQSICPEFTPPETRPALIFELNLGAGYLKKHMDRELYIIVSGSRQLDLDHAALVPKGEFLTVSLTGKSIDRAVFPEDTAKLITAFMDLPHIRSLLPGISATNVPVACSCCPLMAVSPARGAFSDRIALIGDAFGARLYRDGLYSSFVMAKRLATTLLDEGTDQKSLGPFYRRTRQWLKKDIDYGNRIIGLTQFALKSPFLSRVCYQTFATEMKFKHMDQWPLGKALWQIGSGAGDYQDIFRHLVSGPVFLSFLKGTFRTIRNILTELFFGIRWGSFGRYPTVIIREKREYIKKSIESALDIKLDPSPEMERMYAVKIRASSRLIFRELGKFGDADGKFLRLNFVNVNRVSGKPNQEGATIRYALSRAPVAMDICLVKSIPDKSLFYEPAEVFTRRGRLIFDISPTRDGNNRMVVYTAFDFKKGRSFAGKIFWPLFKRIFPDFAHDVVWNHAICTIKAEAEKSQASVDENKGLVRQPVQHP